MKSFILQIDSNNTFACQTHRSQKPNSLFGFAKVKEVERFKLKTKIVNPCEI